MQVKLDTGFNIEVEFPISPFGRRMAAWIIDIVVIYAYIILVSRFFRYFFGESLYGKDWLFILTFSLPILLYHLICEVFFNGQSLGKKAMSIKVITLEGGQPSLSQYLIRWLFRLADFPLWIFPAIVTGALPWWCSPLLFGGIAAVLASSKSQRLGDIVAGTIIIDTRNKTSWQDTVFTEVESDYQPRYPQVMKLSDKDINTLKSIIETVKKRSDFDLSMKVAERIRTRLTIENDQDSIDFLETLLKDYNYYSTR
ncbi:MAG: hypothetical protein C5B59_05220 [Bacteroidetes bacterium]|nr:MAG: hypothetical protein C5B59_05220 [Bacteroidota bacterium]